MADEKDVESHPHASEGPAKPPLTEAENPLADDDEQARDGNDDDGGWIPPIP
jgi:hypothetical protein